jgi:plastocyanin
MHKLARIALGAVAVVALSACGGGGASQPAASQPATSQAAAACSKVTTAGSVAASIKDFKFDPGTVTAKVGDTITWTNNDSTAHTVTLDGGACDTQNIAAGSTGSLLFAVAGTYPFHCAIHTSMKGTITITG